MEKPWYLILVDEGYYRLIGPFDSSEDASQFSVEGEYWDDIDDICTVQLENPEDLLQKAAEVSTH
jgi:hypothetical protein